MAAIRLYLDHDVDVGLAVRLKARGFDVIATRDVGNMRLTDEQQVTYASSERRAILTHNRRDFKRLHRTWIRQRKKHAGIIISRRVILDELEKQILKLLQSVSADEARERLISLEQSKT